MPIWGCSYLSAPTRATFLGTTSVKWSTLGTTSVLERTILLSRQRMTYRPNRNRKLDLTRSHGNQFIHRLLNKTKSIDMQRSRSRKSGRQADSQTAMVDGV